MIQRSLVLMKPDTMKRGIVGEIMSRFERSGLKIVGAKLIKVEKTVVMEHYKKDPAWHKKVGELSVKDCESYGLDVEGIFGTEDPTEIGKEINSWLYNIFSESPVLAFILEGPTAVEKVRVLVGSTYPVSAPPGTIRGDFGLDSPLSSLKRKRSVLNLVHASGTPEEAEMEIKLWFKEKEILSYRSSQDEVYSY